MPDYEERIARLEAAHESLQKQVNDAMTQFALTVGNVERVCKSVVVFGERVENIANTVDQLQDNEVHMRKTLHELNGNAAANGLKLSEVLRVNDTQTPMLKELHAVVLGTDGMREKVANYGVRFKIVDLILKTALVALVGAIVSNMYQRITHVEKLAEQKIEQKDARP